MCARYTMRVPAESVRDLFNVDEVPEMEPRFNVAPTDIMPVISNRRDGERQVRLMKWGLIPRWAKDPSVGTKMINAKSETAFEKPAFKYAIAHHRCLIPADGFYEWDDVPIEEADLFGTTNSKKTRKQPYHFTIDGGRPFAFGGLYERWEDMKGQPLYSFTILTCEPNAVVASLHDRMPVIVRPENYEKWLDRDLDDQSVIEAMTTPYPADHMEKRAVNPLVGNPRNEGPEMLESEPNF